MKRFIALSLAFLLLFSFMVACSSKSSYTPKKGECAWCNGTGIWAYYDKDGVLHKGICSHCHGTGRR